MNITINPNTEFCSRSRNFNRQLKEKNKEIEYLKASLADKEDSVIFAQDKYIAEAKKSKNASNKYRNMMIVLGFFIASNTLHKCENRVMQKFQKNMTEEFDKSDTKKDTLIVRDINDDENPEIILEKKDGSRIAFDMKRCEAITIPKED